MLFRKTIVSNGKLGWLSTLFCLCLLAVGAFLGISAFLSQDIAAKIFMTFWLVVIGTCSVLAIGGLIFPREYEFVVERDCFRWGRSDKVARQKRLNVQEVAKLVHWLDEGEHMVFAVTQAGKRIRLSGSILYHESDVQLFLKTIRDSFPNILIEDSSVK